MNIFKDRLLHFLVLGAALFAVYGFVDREPDAQALSKKIVIDRDTLLLLESGMRRSLPQIDAERLAPHFDRVFGRPQTRGMLERVLSRAPDTTSENRIKKLLGNYPEQ